MPDVTGPSGTVKNSLTLVQIPEAIPAKQTKSTRYLTTYKPTNLLPKVMLHWQSSCKQWAPVTAYHHLRRFSQASHFLRPSEIPQSHHDSQRWMAVCLVSVLRVLLVLKRIWEDSACAIAGAQHSPQSEPISM